MNDTALILADGEILPAISVGYPGVAFGEMVFNTSMYGYQAILSDPSYTEQIVVFTYPHIGNVGINPYDFESEGFKASGMVVRHLGPETRHWQRNASLQETLKAQRCVALSGVDTRYLTHKLRVQGAMNAALVGVPTDHATVIEALQHWPSMQGRCLTQQVTTAQAYTVPAQGTPLGCRVVLCDFGVKRSILQALSQAGLDVHVVPANTPWQDLAALKPDGLVLSSGPGDPEACLDAIDTARTGLTCRIPMLGICLGGQILALAMGARTRKMSFGHHGGNHPVIDHSGHVCVTSQNHGFCVDDTQLPATLVVTHRSGFDQTLQGWRHRTLPAWGFQGHPEAGPGPHDARFWYQDFAHAVSAHKQRQHKERTCPSEAIYDAS